MKRSATMLGALLLACLCGGCGSSGSAGVGGSTTITDTAAIAPISAGCSAATLGALEEVAHRIYQESASGRIVAEADYRLSHSSALSEAVALDDRTAARKVLHELVLNQIVSARVTRDGRTLAELNRGIGIAPVSGRLRNREGQPVGAFTVAVQGANGYAQTTTGLAATQVLLRSGSRLLASTLNPAPTLQSGAREVAWDGVSYKVDTFAGRTFPNAPLSISLLVPPSSIAPVCKADKTAIHSPAQARADTLGLVAQRIYSAEHTGSKAALLRGYVEHASAFREAVLAGNARATRKAIVGFFASHLHVVRVRVIRDGKLLIDVGGPHVLGPIHGVIRNAAGKVAARFSMGIQDDKGFTILAHTFTGARVLMREGANQVEGDLRPGPTAVPNRGTVSYRGVRYQVYSFPAEAFPSGPLRISLLFAQR
jgi:hypothetical protein